MKDKAPDIKILTIRDQKVVLDSDLAPVYSVTTKRLNEQLRRNRKRFPEDFAFQLTAEEFAALTSQIATLDEGTPRGETKRSQSATTSRKRRRKTHRPRAFTEHGALQAANILRSDRAIAMSVYVIRAFIEQREKLAANAAILKQLAEIDKTLLEHDTALRDIYQKLLPLLCACDGTTAPANRISSCKISGSRCVGSMRSQIATASQQPANWSQIATSSAVAFPVAGMIPVAM